MKGERMVTHVNAPWMERLDALEKRYEEVMGLMAQPEIATSPERLAELAREQGRLEEAVALYREYKTLSLSLEETQTLLQDNLEPELVALAKQEIEELQQRRSRVLEKLQSYLLPQDPRDQRDVIIEIRAGAGGEEAALFAADLFRMYSRYALNRGWEIEMLDSSPSDLGGFKEVVFEVRGPSAFSRLKHERGVHRVQRVPATEASGRIHTSTTTVAVLPEADEVEVQIRPEDLKMEFYHSGGPGGQNVNKVATAVRITHLPTGMVAICQEERSQLRNRQKAMAILRARLLEHESQQQQEEISQERRSQVGSGERAEKVRTYNFPQNRVTDHRLNLTLHNLPQFLDGELDELLDQLASAQS